MTNTKITMIDYGGSNLRSVQKAFEHVGATVHITSNPQEILTATKLVLPGVGAFGAGMAALKQRHLDTAVCQATDQGIPLLGICLGMQFLFEHSNEMGHHAGLALISGHVTRFPKSNNLKTPHIGWNQIQHTQNTPLLQNIPNTAYTYFVHTYHCVPANPNTIIAYTEYGQSFAAIVGQDNIYGIQFHPEKSQQVGLQILKNYLNL